MTCPHRTDTPSGRRAAKFSVAALVLAVGLAGAASGQPAVSQRNPPAAAGTAGVEVAPRGQREVQDIVYSDWRKLCFKPGGARMICRTSITGSFATGQMAVRLDLIEREDGGAPRLQLFAPVGMYLPPGVKLTIDQREPHQAPYSWCLTNACIAGTVADPKMIQQMASGQILRLEFVDSNLLSLTTSVPLAQFASVHKGAPTRTFEQDIDE